MTRADDDCSASTCTAWTTASSISSVSSSAPEGVTASFVKELIRHAVLHAAEADEAARVSDEDVEAALVDLLEHSAPVLRSSLGANPDLAELADVDASPEGRGPDDRRLVRLRRRRPRGTARSS